MNLGISSVANRFTFNIRQWDGDNFSGNMLLTSGNTPMSNLANYNRFGLATWDNAIRSFANQ
jgi:hypothetical protein